MIENYNVLTARFVDNQRKTVEVLWKDPSSDKVVSEYVEASINDTTWNYLVKQFGEETIHHNTHSYMKELKVSYEKQLEEIAKKNGDWIDVADNSKFLEKLIDLLLKEEKEIKKEELFKFKLAVFDYPKINESTDIEMKSSLRKAKTYLEIIKILGDI